MFEIKISELIWTKGFVATVVFGSSWVVDLLGFLAAFETCPFWVLVRIIALYLQTHRYHSELELLFYFIFFFFGGVRNKWIREFSLFCFSSKNHDCVYGLLIKIQFLTFFSYKKLKGVFLAMCVVGWPNRNKKKMK